MPYNKIIKQCVLMFSVNTTKWNEFWKKHKMFLFDESNYEKEIFSIDTPPPFTSGELHMGQAFWVCYIDSIARYKYMQGFNILYPQGWDAQGFPTEMLVEKKYGKGLERSKFYEKCEEISNQNIELMRTQMESLGSTFDKKHQYITMSKEYRRKIQLSLIIMHEKNMVYRGTHPIEWCTHCETSIAREQIEERPQSTLLNYIEFEISGTSQKLLIATTRPELIHACVAIAVNPADKRYSKILGKDIITPIFNKLVPVIADESVETDFGSGAEMICTFGDKNDVMFYYKHKLNLINAIDEKGHLKDALEFTGLTLKTAREKILEKLKGEKLLIKQEPLNNTVKVHDRCGTPVEFVVSTQWFLKTKEYGKKIIECAEQMQWIPNFSINRLKDWANFIEWDWNISRNRIFGTPIPFWHCQKCDYILVPQKEKLPVNPAHEKPDIEICPKCGSKIVGATETCDVWVDSSITPLIIAGWPDNNELIKRAFPATMRIQGTDIIRTWAFYTIFRTLVITGNKPFEKILTTGMILGTDKKEMHKSWGNGISPATLIEKYSVDVVRLWAALSGGIGKDRAFSYSETDYANAFIIKLYNSAMFIQKATEEKQIKTDLEDLHKHFSIFDLWILNRLNKTIKEVQDAYDALNLYDAMNKAINFYRSEFCDYYIENVKYRVYGNTYKENRDAALYCLRHVLLTSLKFLAPVIPYTCEEINSMFDNKTIFAEFPKYAERPSQTDYVINGFVFQNISLETDPEEIGILLNDIITSIRKAKSNKKLALNKEIDKVKINIPEQYIKITEDAADEIKGICKIKNVIVKPGSEIKIEIEE